MTHPDGPFASPVFDHRQHLRFAWSVLGVHPEEVAARIVGDEIRSFAAERAPGKYHETLTVFWVRLVAHTLRTGPGGDFQTHLERFPILLDTRAPWKHYSGARLSSDEARAHFVEPDLLPLP